MKTKALYVGTDATGETVRVTYDCTGQAPPASILLDGAVLRLTLTATLNDPSKRQVLVTGVHKPQPAKNWDSYRRFLDDLTHTNARDRRMPA